MCQDYNINSDVIPRIASGFGGGIGNTGATCGAVVGAVMAIGLIKERGESLEDYMSLAKVVQEFRSRFEAEMNTINCRELTGLDLTKEIDSDQLMNSDIPATVCIPAVGLAYRLVVDLLKETQ